MPGFRIAAYYAKPAARCTYGLTVSCLQTVSYTHLTLPEIAQKIAELADKARNNKLKPNDLTGATFTVTNIGSEGALLDTPILVPPQAGILGLSLIHISEPTRREWLSRMPSSA